MLYWIATNAISPFKMTFEEAHEYKNVSDQWHSVGSLLSTLIRWNAAHNLVSPLLIQSSGIDTK